MNMPHFVYQFISGWTFGCSHFLAAMSDAAMNICATTLYSLSCKYCERITNFATTQLSTSTVWFCAYILASLNFCFLCKLSWQNVNAQKCCLCRKLKKLSNIVSYVCLHSYFTRWLVGKCSISESV